MVFMDYKPRIRFVHLSMHIQVSSSFWCAVDWQSLSCPRRSQYVGGAAWSGISWQSRVPFMAVAQVHLGISWVDGETGKARSWWIWHDQDIYIYIQIYIYVCLDYIMKYDVSWSWIVFSRASMACHRFDACFLLHCLKRESSHRQDGGSQARGTCHAILVYMYDNVERGKTMAKHWLNNGL